MVRLKKGQEMFEIVDGPDAGKRFIPGVEYEKAPAGYESRFEKIKLGPQVKPEKKGDK